MTIHLSARLAWHDRGWNGCICNNPKSNVSCMVHEHIRESRDDEFETQNAGKSLYELSAKKLPPCSRDPGVFSSTGFKIIHYDPLDWRSLPATEEEIPPYSFCTSPYGRMFREDGETYVNKYNASFDRNSRYGIRKKLLEEAMREIGGYTS